MESSIQGKDVMKVLLYTLILGLFFPTLNMSYAAEVSSSIPIKSEIDKYKLLTTSYSALDSYKHELFFDWINTKAFMRKTNSSEERKRARKAWKKGLGVDIFYPYFELKKAKHTIEDKTEIKIFKMKGKAKIERDEIQYIFRARF